MPIEPASFARLPSLPAVAVKLLQLFSNPDVSLGAVADVLRPDPALTARLLRAASSAEFGVGRPLTDTRRAVQMLGTRRVTSLALSFLLSDDATRPGPVGEQYREIWIRCVVQAVAMELLAARRARGAESEHFTVGLLLEIGALALLRSSPDEFLKASAAAWAQPERREQIEAEIIGCTQSDVTVALFRHWRLPTMMTEAVRLRRGTIIDLSQSTSASHRVLIEGAAMATWVGDYFCTGDTGNALIRCLELGEMLFRMGVSDVRGLLSDVHAKVLAGATLFNTDLSRMESPDALMERAKTQMAELLSRLQEAQGEHVAEAGMLEEHEPQRRAARLMAALAN
ncbi:HDOD domain-containing protein [Caulifigura coniformis]|uniref:HDOD domain-containing protein n=1 Tax=Caulifigura coniformis TaxID=2527983 RepID=UPI0018D207D1|nr:HDOD domain-containing protein [Caulifigura coniformis]